MYALINEYITHFSQNVPKSKSSNFHWTKRQKNLLTQLPALHTLEKPHALSEISRDSQGPLMATSGSDFLFLLNSLTSLLPHSSHPYTVFRTKYEASSFICKISPIQGSCWDFYWRFWDNREELLPAPKINKYGTLEISVLMFLSTPETSNFLLLNFPLRRVTLPRAPRAITASS